MPQQLSDVRERIKYNYPRLYKVIIFNDDVTTMDFVVMILQKIFHKSEKEAETLMLDVHNNGQAVVGVYTFDIAKTKVNQVSVIAKEKGFPLRLVFQPE